MKKILKILFGALNNMFSPVFPRKSCSGKSWKISSSEILGKFVVGNTGKSCLWKSRLANSGKSRSEKSREISSWEIPGKFGKSHLGKSREILGRDFFKIPGYFNYWILKFPFPGKNDRENSRYSREILRLMKSNKKSHFPGIKIIFRNGIFICRLLKFPGKMGISTKSYF